MVVDHLKREGFKKEINLWLNIVEQIVDYAAVKAVNYS
jgi:hypothetical protein